MHGENALSARELRRQMRGIEPTVIDNEGNTPGGTQEFRVRCVRHQNGEIEIFGWVQSVEQFREMKRVLYNEFSRTLSEDQCSEI
jgi:hypothetical protein